MHRYVQSLVSTLVPVLLLFAGAASAQDRFALVIANSAYQSIEPLPNPARDAIVIEGFLKTAGFQVTLARDLDQRALRDAVTTFAAELATKGPETVALVYFAGHGLQVDGRNYLLPVDARIAREADVPLQGVRFADLMDTLDRVPGKTRIFVLDACRHNPFEAVEGARGLAIVAAPPGTIVAYSTSPGATAEDGIGNNSPFVLALIEAASRPGAPIETTLKDTRLAVHAATSGRQIPWEVSSLVAPFAFLPGETAKSEAPATARDEAAWREELQKRSAAEAAEIVIREDDVTVYQVFLALYPDAPDAIRFRAVLDRRLEMWAWFEAVSLDTAEAYEAFLARFSQSDLAAAARRLAERARRRSNFAQSVSRGLPVLATAGAAQTLAGVSSIAAPSSVRTVVKEVIREVRVPSPPIIKTVIKEVPGPARVIERVVRVPSPPKVITRVETKVVRVPAPCRCHGRAGGGGGGGGFGISIGGGPRFDGYRGGGRRGGDFGGRRRHR
jgi:uncharacterized caspase-like protein